MSDITTNQSFFQADYLPAALTQFKDGKESLIYKDLSEEQELSILVDLAKRLKRRIS